MHLHVGLVKLCCVLLVYWLVSANEISINRIVKLVIQMGCVGAWVHDCNSGHFYVHVQWI